MPTRHAKATALDAVLFSKDAAACLQAQAAKATAQDAKDANAKDADKARQGTRHAKAAKERTARQGKCQGRCTLQIDVCLYCIHTFAYV